jgi:hypothetical protein
LSVPLNAYSKEIIIWFPEKIYIFFLRIDDKVRLLGDAAAWPVKAFITKFRDNFEKAPRNFTPLNVVHGVRHRAEKFEVVG